MKEELETESKIRGSKPVNY